MERLIKKGDLVKALTGRDKGKDFLVLEVIDRYAYIINGKDRKISSPKKKNIKHVKLILSESLVELAENIKSGKVIGNKRISLSIKSEKQKLQED